MKKIYLKKCLMAICSIVLLNIMCACNDVVDSAPYLGFENLKYVKHFDERSELVPDSMFKSGVYIEDFAICDSLVFTGSGAWDVRTLSDWKSLRMMFSQGHAYGEFLQFPKIYKASFIHENNDLCTIVYDMGNGNVYKANVTQTLASDTLCIEKVKHNAKKWLDRYLYIDSTEYVVRENKPGNASPKKLTLFKNNEVVPNKYFQKLDKIELHSDDFNILAAFEGYNPLNRVMIQVYCHFNIINIIPLDDKEKAVTVCYGDNGVPLSEVEAAKELEYFFYNVKTYEDCFAVLCWKDKNKPTVQIYDYEGNPLREYALPKPATSFDIDWKNHHLYTYNNKDGLIVRYKFEY